MKMPVNNRFSILLGERRVQEKRNIPLTEIAEVTGISYPTLLAWSKNQVARYDVPVINALAKYFKIKNIGELLEYVEEEPESKKASRK